MSKSQHILSDNSRLGGVGAFSQVGAFVRALACDFHFYPQAALATPKRRPVARTRVMAHPCLIRGEVLAIARRIDAVIGVAEASVDTDNRPTSTAAMASNRNGLVFTVAAVAPWKPSTTAETNRAPSADANRNRGCGVASAFYFSTTDKENNQ